MTKKHIITCSMDFLKKIVSISIDDASPDMLLAKTIFSPKGEILLHKDAKLCEPTILRLKNAGISNVYIYEASILPTKKIQKLAMSSVLESFTPQVKKTESPLLVKRTVLESPVVKIPKKEDIIPNIVRIQTTKMVINLFKNPKTVTFKQIANNVSIVIDEILKTEKTVVPINNLRTYDNYTYEHCVNVCVLGVTMGKMLGYNKEQLRVLGIGLLLHDFGKTSIPLEILNKPGKLTDEEFKIIKTHPEQGLKKLNDLYTLEPQSKQIVLQHHERVNGRGYPQGLKENEIHDYAKITAIADVYDAVTSDRIYNMIKSPKEALSLLMKGAGTDFDNYFLHIFLTMVPVDPGEPVPTIDPENGLKLQLDIFKN